ncbi:MAG: cobalt ECF transporter T component CbiQ [Syntrophales bacterium]
MHLEEFAEGGSFLHRIDPRVKFIAFVPYVFTIALMHAINGPLAGLLISALMIIVAEIDFRKLISRLVVINSFIFVLWVFLPFSYPGQTVFSSFSLTATREGILYALSITLKANAIFLATIAILGTSEVNALAHALVHFKIPDKLVHLFFFFYRYISVLHEEYRKLKNAMAIRSFRPGTNVHTYRTYGYLVGMLLVRSYERSQRIHRAMLCRGANGKFHIMSHFRLKKADILFGLTMFVITFMIWFIGWYSFS